MKFVFGLGSNIGDKSMSLIRGAEFISTLGTIIKSSSVYETTPVGMAPGTANFYNQVMILESETTPGEMIKRIKAFEKKSGRDMGNSHMRSRPIDIDILLAGDTIMSGPALTIPHPEMTNRRFVLLPLAEISPDLVHPSCGKTIRTLLNELNSNEKVIQLKQK